MPEEIELVSGEAERVGIKSTELSVIYHKTGNTKRTVRRNLPDHGSAFLSAIDLISKDNKEDPEIYFDCFAHRYVNAGKHFTKTSLIKTKNLQQLQSSFSLAPLHNPICYQLIEICDKKFHDIPQYIVLDNAFHKTIPQELATYPIPYELTNLYKIRKVGYHGISHQFVMNEACRYLSANIENQKIISCHLGTGGSSVCAIRYGESINSSMGFTPLEGLLMNTRSGDVDIGIIFYIMYNNELNSFEAEDLFNKKSGVLGIYKNSSDLRDAIEHMKTDPQGRLVLDMYVNRIKKYIGYYTLLLKKTDILIFTDTLGVESSVIRALVCRGMEYSGIKIDNQLNESYKNGTADLSARDSEVRILVIPTNEELMIARESYNQARFLQTQHHK